ncbi:related to BNR/Asp-box repeat domain protein [Cephalotrichum gorgonifer]|uniref:Related to BNR/Asp-box repeat domain protein n=1 Tax=Cephalotrichum gorgonifer TaxID=2041049 RepID=A0AAE8SRP4_9PEZI|nr:related to BNR/Asp-box repeat domain protein [Cephalotrichum gorgonifer]
MRVQTLLQGLALVTLASARRCNPRDRRCKPDNEVSDTYTTFDNRVIYTPDANFTDPGVLYARTLELSDGTLLATWENYSPEPPLVHFPIYRSLDRGASWTEISQVHDEVNGWGLRYQPNLFELPKDVGDFKKGTIIVAGNSIPTDLSKTQIDVYASRDKGLTWEFVSHVAAGGVANPVNWEDPVWEPHMVYHKGKIILYYADQRPEGHGQVQSHQTSTDLRNWSDVVYDVIYDDPDARPGMPAVARLPDDTYIYTYEYGGDPAYSTYRFPIHYRISSDPTAFGSARDFPIKVGDSVPTTGPFVVWTPWGGPNGTIVVSAYQGEVYANKALGDPSAWTVHATPQPGAYTRNLRIFKDRPDLMIIAGAGVLPPSKTNKVSLSVVDLEKIIGSN